MDSHYQSAKISDVPALVEYFVEWGRVCAQYVFVNTNERY
jgi:hypothetical protein